MKYHRTIAFLVAVLAALCLVTILSAHSESQQTVYIISSPPPLPPDAVPPLPSSGGFVPTPSAPRHASMYTHCHIKHAATPAQICPAANGMQYWFIGPDGSSQRGPFLPDNPKITRYEGTNPLSGKSVVIDYVTEGKKLLLRVSTFYPDTEHDINKPYIFTLDPGHAVKYISW